MQLADEAAGWAVLVEEDSNDEDLYAAGYHEEHGIACRK
jgi:hypothetical protein